MRIGISTLACVPGRSGGDARYVRELIAHLPLVDQKNTYFIFVAPWNRTWFESQHSHVRLVTCSVPRSFSLRAAWEQIYLPLLARRLHLDLFHAPINVAPLAVPCTLVLTLLEAEPFLFPDSIPPQLLLYWRIMRMAAAQRATRIIAISESSKGELIRTMGISADMVEVTYLGVNSDRFDQHASQSGATLPYGVEQPFLLWVGRTYPRKNVKRAIQAFIAVKAKGIPHKLVLAGTAGWADSEVKEAIRDARLNAHDIIVLGYVDDTVLSTLYAQATAFLFPSIHEAFGLPVLEAMASGLPVITSATTATAEVSGDHAILVDPLDVHSIAAGIERAIEYATDTSGITARTEAARQHARQFSWLRTAAQTLEIYNRARDMRDPIR
jgi:glycosyltransferase involved in cell wall biosynthesis